MDSINVDRIPDVIIRTLNNICCNADKIRTLSLELEKERLLTNKTLYDMETAGHAINDDIYALRKLLCDIR